MRIPTWNFADRLRKARQEIHLTQRDFAEQLQVTAAAYSQWEAGNARPRDVVSVAKRVELLTQIPASWLLDVGPAPLSATSFAADGGRSGPADPTSWAPRGSNPEPAVSVVDLDKYRRHRKPTGSVSALVNEQSRMNRSTIAS